MELRTLCAAIEACVQALHCGEFVLPLLNENARSPVRYTPSFVPGKKFPWSGRQYTAAQIAAHLQLTTEAAKRKLRTLAWSAPNARANIAIRVAFELLALREEGWIDETAFEHLTRMKVERARRIVERLKARERP